MDMIKGHAQQQMAPTVIVQTIPLAESPIQYVLKGMHTEDRNAATTIATLIAQEKSIMFIIRTRIPQTPMTASAVLQHLTASISQHAILHHQRYASHQRKR